MAIRGLVEKKSLEIYTRIASYWRNSDERLVRRSKRLSWLFHKLCVYICNYCAGGICIIESDYIALTVNFLGGTAMNKQETIKKLESIKVIGNDAIAACYNESINAGITLMKKIDEPQKPVMPKFFDDWAKQVLEKRDKFYAISLITRAGWGYGVDYELNYELNYDRSPSGTKELLNWLVENEGDDYPNKKKATEALLYGYEVEKEPLYYVRLPYEVWDEEAAELKTEYLYLHYEITSDETRIFPTKEPRKGFVTKLDELTIKSADERYWPFAVPVEEVAEG